MALLVVLSARANIGALNIVPLLCSDPSWDGEPEKDRGDGESDLKKTEGLIGRSPGEPDGFAANLRRLLDLRRPARFEDLSSGHWRSSKSHARRNFPGSLFGDSLRKVPVTPFLR